MSTYVYAFTGTAHPLPLDGLAGVGARKPALRLVRHDGLAAVVSDAPENLRAKAPRRRGPPAGPRHAVGGGDGPADAVWDGGGGRDAVKAELASGAKRYAGLLKRLAARSRSTSRRSTARRPSCASRCSATASCATSAWRCGPPAVAARRTRVAFGQQVSVAMDARRSQDGERVVAELRPHASAVQLGPAVDGCFVNASFLLGANEREDFEAALSRLRQELSELVEIRLYGPLPPYSFLASGKAGD